MSTSLLRVVRILLLGGLLGRAVGAETLTIATYNIANYNVTDRMTAEGYRPDYPKPEVEKSALRRVLAEIDADVIALQEVGGDAFLRELQRDLRHERVVYDHTAILVAGNDARHLAVLSRRPLVRVRRHVDLPFRYFETEETVRRGLLEVAVQIGAGELTLFIVHLKSRYTERPDDPLAARLRSGEAQVVRDRILDVIPSLTDAAVAALGDFNDGLRERPVQAFLQRGERRLFEVVEVADERGDRWTHHYRRNDTYSRVDHVLISPRLRSSVMNARIHDSPDVRVASDHRPVVVTLRLD
ncbi:MAG TPA: endonuclease/exonuclease/phosphatase family protein [Candidatus Synoicihabitans sp.]|nr:endonuclease/exonuclease/phosphatase family protein [Candidatus Synoicihabitans sp.]